MAHCDSYDEGECTWGACETQPWVPEGLGNANQWCQRAPAHGLIVSSEPQMGSIACFRPGGLYDPTYGHLGVVLAVDPSGQRYEVWEMNYVGWKRADTRWTTLGAEFGFILPPGTVGPPAVVPPTPDLGPFGPLVIAWQGFQDYWNDRIEQQVVELQLAQAQLERLSRR